MANRLQKAPQYVYTPAVPPTPARPPYCTTTVSYSKPAGNNLAIGGSGGTKWSNMTYDAMLADARARGWDGVGFAVVAPSPQRPGYNTTQTCYPGVPGKPGSPSSLNTQALNGWNGGARSARPIPLNGFFQCRLPVSPVATMVGLTGAALRMDYSAMPIAVVLRPTGATVVEFGVDKTPELPYPAGGLLELRRMPSGRTSVVIGGTQVHVSESLVLSPNVYAGALLYSLQDVVEDAAIGTLAAPAQFSGRTPAMRALIGDAPITKVDAEIPGIRLDALLSPVEGVINFSATLPSLQALVTDRPVMTLVAKVPRSQLQAALGRPEATTTGLVAVLPPPRLEALLMSGGKCRLDAELPRLATLISDRHLMTMRGRIPMSLQLRVGEPYMPAGEIDGSDVVIALDTAIVDTVLVLLAMDSLDVSCEATLTFVLELSAMDSLRLNDFGSFGQLVEMLAMERVVVTSDAMASRRQAIQYAVNSLTGAPTTYEGFDFLSFAQVQGTTYGVRQDGLYRLGDRTDNGELISALIDFGTSDFADSHVKRIETAYLGVRTDGQCFLRVQADAGAERVYRVVGQSNVKRSALAKGVAGRSWSLKLELVDASFAEVDALELLVGATQRRGFGYRTR